MTRFRYTAVDSQGKPVSGELEAAGKEQALAQLASQGLQAGPADLTAVPAAAFWVDRLSAEEAVELGARVGDLAKAGLPLGPGLRAMADELPRGRLGRVLNEMAGHLDAGGTLASVMEAQGARLPAHVRGLVLAGIRSGRLGEAMEQFVAIERGRMDLRRRTWLALVYPLVLMSLLVGLFLLFFLAIVPQFAQIFSDFGAELPEITKLLIWTSSHGIWAFVGIVAVLVGGLALLGSVQRPAWVRALFYWIPVIGTLWYWSRLADFARLMRLLLEQQIPLPDALRLAADGLRDSYLSGGCRGLATEVESGRPLSEGLARFRQFPAGLRPLVSMGQRTPSLAGAFQAAAELFETRVQVYCRLLETVLPPITFVVIVVAIMFVLIALFLPLISLITKLSG